VIRRERPELPAHKPVAEMTTEERSELVRQLRRITRHELAELNRPKRERKLRKGLVAPRNQAERDIFLVREGEPPGDQAVRRRRPSRASRQAIAADAERLSRTEQVRDGATAEDVGQWMARRLKEDGRLNQRSAARVIADRFGEEFTCLTGRGHLAISERVLRAFRRAADSPSWDQRGLCWIGHRGNVCGQRASQSPVVSSRDSAGPDFICAAESHTVP
jgi:hypothetical protein